MCENHVMCYKNAKDRQFVSQGQITKARYRDGSISGDFRLLTYSKLKCL